MPQSFLLGLKTLSPAQNQKSFNFIYNRNKYKYHKMNNELNSIGLDKDPSDTTVVVAMSGGVDPLLLPE